MTFLEPFPPPQPPRLVHPRIRIGIDLGGTKIEGIALSESGEECCRRRIATPQGDYAQTLDCILGLILHLETQVGAQGSVGIGTPGAPSRITGKMKNSNTTCLNGQPLQRDLEARLGRPIRLANDANCFALSEAVDGAGAGADVVFGVILGTGVGGGVAVSGRVLAGANGIAGEWGHNPLPLPIATDHPLPSCYCGRQGCIETYLSGPGLARDHRQITGAEATPEAIAAGATTGDRACLETLERYSERLARALATVVNVLDPEVIVLGGGLSSLPGLCEAVTAKWGDAIFSDQVATRLVLNRHGDSSGVRGAAWLWEPGIDPLHG